MAVSGFTSFLTEIGLRPVRLQNTYVIVDGSNLIITMLGHELHSAVRFSGDYDMIYQSFRRFYDRLLKCNVTPITFFMGFCHVNSVNKVNRNSSGMIPLFSYRCLEHVLTELRLLHVYCFSDIRLEITKAAQLLNCPVLSYNSEFCFYNVRYILSLTICSEYKKSLNHREVIKDDNNGESEDISSIHCYTYDFKILCKVFPGLKIQLLPFIPIIYSNKYSSLLKLNAFHKFLSQRDVSKYSKHINVNKFGRFVRLLDWLANVGSIEEAKEIIKTVIGKEMSADEVDVIITEAIGRFTATVTNITIQFYVKLHSGLVGIIGLEELKLSGKIIQFLVKGIDPYLLSILYADFIQLGQSVQDNKKPHCHTLSIPIIKAILKILKAFCDFTEDYVKIYMKEQCIEKFSTSSIDCHLNGVDVKDILNQTSSKKIELIYDILSLTADEREALSIFDNDWVIFIICIIYWMKNEPEVSKIHIHALILMSLCNYIQNNETEKNEYFNILPTSFTYMINNIKATEVESFQKFLHEFTRQEYLISIVHIYSIFQSCLYYLMELNILLDFPLPQIKISKFYSGTIVYKFYLLLNNYLLAKDVHDLLSESEGIQRLYNLLTERLCSLIEVE